MEEKIGIGELTHEELLSRNRYDLQSWLDYLEFHAQLVRQNQRGFESRIRLFKRALKALPGSYKLWHLYLTEFTTYYTQTIVMNSRDVHQNSDTIQPQNDSESYEIKLVSAFEKALETMSRMPVIWKMYISLLLEQIKNKSSFASLEFTRRNCDRALQSLPIAQHSQIWPMYLELLDFYLVYSTDGRVIDSVLSVLKRYAKIEPKKGAIRRFEVLRKCERFDEAAIELFSVLEGSEEGSSEEENQIIWTDLIEMCIEHAAWIQSVDVDKLIRSAIDSREKSGNVGEIGELWSMLAEFYASKGDFEKSRQVFDSALESVRSVADFSLLFDAYSRMEESLLDAYLEIVQSSTDELDSELLKTQMNHIEQLVESRPLLLNAVGLRENPQNVFRWHERAKILLKKGRVIDALETYNAAIETVDPWKCIHGRSYTLWLAYSQLYESQGEFEFARDIFKRAVKSPTKFKTGDDLAAVWCQYIEFELRRNQRRLALDLATEATQRPEYSAVEKNDNGDKNRVLRNVESALAVGSGHVEIDWQYDNEEFASMRYWRSDKLWNLRLDLSQIMLSVEETGNVYSEMIESGIASVQDVFDCVGFLQSNAHFEQSFSILEKSVRSFPWPVSAALWMRYLSSIVTRFGSNKRHVERVRDLFESAMKHVPKKDPLLKNFALMYINFELSYGSPRRALRILERACVHAADDDCSDLISVWILTSASVLGVAGTRDVFERAIRMLKDVENVLSFTVVFSRIEVSLGEIDRARSILKHASQIANPDDETVTKEFWDAWNDFELQHGSEDSFRDMLRMKRAVRAQFSQSYMLLPGAARALNMAARPNATLEDGAFGLNEESKDANEEEMNEPKIENESTGRKRGYSDVVDDAESSDQKPEIDHTNSALGARERFKIRREAQTTTTE
uniref:Suppressor of forked domain-containing protein n=1 Tax=Timspurckia oligopyrenoides TaxID=708627 RepID=A0A7S1ESR0_9RHOD